MAKTEIIVNIFLFILYNNLHKKRPTNLGLFLKLFNI